jgi:hypothetical protein
VKHEHVCHIKLLLTAACTNDIANATVVSCTGLTDQQAIACIPNFAVSNGVCSGAAHETSCYVATLIVILNMVKYAQSVAMFL